ncbi:MAG: sulfatase-like hydrolase/transferase, partial [Anaerohalosphaera sp.]|nr:sulfatase-like hydrolase/transferase [Anaerohalosphaera sp.]
IDALAAKGIVFENVYSPVPLTLPAHSSMLTGTIPPYHGVHDNLTEKLSEDNVTLSEILQQNGFKTSAVVSAVVLAPKFGLNQGFDEYYGDFTPTFEGDPFAEQKGQITTQQACGWLDNNSQQPFFLFLHYYDPHIVYDPPEPFASRFADDLYAGEIAYTDHCIGQVIDKLKTLKLYDSTLIVITGDHGEMLGEHGESTHGYFVYESAVKVPLIVRSPGVRGGRRISDTVGLIDIMPTVLGMLDLPTPPHVQGQNLCGFFSESAKTHQPRYVYTESLTPTQYKCNPLLAVVEGSWKYIYTTKEELYDLKNDPAEKNNLARTQSKRAALMQKNLQLILDDNLHSDQTDTSLKLDKSTIDRLRSLGYVGSGVEEVFELDVTKLDAKNCISFHERYRLLKGAQSAQKYEEGWKLCSQLFNERPDLEFLYPLASIFTVKTDRMAQAVTYLRHDLKTDPADYKARNNLATALSRLKKEDEAVAQWQEVVRQEPDYFNAHDNLAATFYKQRDFRSAIHHWTHANRIKPDDLQILNNLAWLLATTDDPDLRNADQAVRLASNACRLTSFKQPGYLDTLAASYASAGQFDNAVETAKKAIDIAAAQNQKNMADQINKRLSLYKNGKMYIETNQ